MAMAVRSALQSDWGIGETGVAGPGRNARGISPGVCGIAVVGPDGIVRSKTLMPDMSLSAADAYGQPAKVPREEAMRIFKAAAIELLCDAVESAAPPGAGGAAGDEQPR
jgi:nicotinamide mononucleotide (NMN) deamidase PncC